MIQLSPTMRARLSEPVMSTFLLIETEGGLRKTSYPYDLVFNGMTFDSDGTLAKVDLPRMTSVVDKQKFSIVMVDSAFEFASTAEDGLVGQKVSVWMSCLDDNGNPILTTPDVILIYRGRIDAPSHQVDTNHSGSAFFTIDCGSPVADLDRVRTFYASQDYMDKNYPGDNSFEQIFATGGPVSLRWGKA